MTRDIFIAANRQLGPRPPFLSNQDWNQKVTTTINTMSGFPSGGFNATPPAAPSSAAKATPNNRPRTPLLPLHFINPRPGERAATPQQCIQMGQFHAVNNALDGVREALDLLKNVSVDNDSPIRNLNFDTNGNGKKILAFKCLC